MALIVGVDPSAKKIAVVAYDTVTLTQSAVAFPLYAKGQTRQDTRSLLVAMQSVADFARRVADVSPDDRVAYVEEPLVGRGGTKTTIKQAYVGGIIRACLADAGFTVRDVHVSTWRKELGITARDTKAIKAATYQAVSAHWPKIAVEVKGDDDLTDAAAICLFGQAQRRKAGRLREPTESTELSVQGRRPRPVLR